MRLAEVATDGIGADTSRRAAEATSSAIFLTRR
jgi:hypothetical protein